MIDRKAVWISFVLLIAMLAATFWRLSMLPDWNLVPVEGPGSYRLVPASWIFVIPLTVLIVMGIFFASRWLIGSGPEEALQALRRRRGRALLFAVGLGSLAQAFNLARSLGVLQSVDREILAHVVFVAVGIFLMVAGNVLPKQPWLTTRYSPLDAWQWNRHVRFAGKLMVVLGLLIAVGTLLLPIRIATAAVQGLTLAFVAAIFGHRTSLRRASITAGALIAAAGVALGGFVMVVPWLTAPVPPPGFEQGDDLPKLVGRWSFSTDGAPNSVQFNADGTVAFQRGASGQFWLRGDGLSLYLGGPPIAFTIRFLSDTEIESTDTLTGAKSLMVRRPEGGS